MKRINILLGILLLFIISFTNTFAKEVWINDLKNLYTSGNAIIYGINIRTFAAKDINGDGIINEASGEVKGNFLNAIDRLDELAKCGINTINILPILPVGKTNALGTAGSLYAPSEFDSINKQLKAKNSKLSLESEMIKFINECHNRKIRVIVDLPGCASYDLYNKNKELFIKDFSLPEYPDVLFLDGGSESSINRQVYNLYYDFIQMILAMGVDGVKTNFPELKPKAFWQKLIGQIKLTDPQFLFLADNQNSKLVENKGVNVLSKNDLLDAGFDGYFSDYSNFSEWKNAQDLYNAVKVDLNTSKKYNNRKKATANFATPNQLSPIIINGKELSKLVISLQSTLPVNAYYTDGFITGDNYIFPSANKKAKTSETDDFRYFTNRGKLDIYNFSRKPVGTFKDIKDYFVKNNIVKFNISRYNASQDRFSIYKTNNNEVFAYGRDFGNIAILTVGNLNMTKENNVLITISDLKDGNILPITAGEFERTGNKLKLKLLSGEAAIFIVIKQF